MNRSAIFIVLSIMFSGGVAADQIAEPRLTVKTLITHYSGQTGVPLHEQSADAYIKTQFADGYLAGVADSTQGAAWCDKGKVKIDEINSMVIAELRKLPSMNQNQSAAQAAIRVLAARFPCE